MLRKLRRSNQAESDVPAQAGLELSPEYNPNRDKYLFWRTSEGYIIAQDIACQREYAQAGHCPHCGGRLMVVAQLNRSWQGLSELVCLCTSCRQRSSFIFDISNDAYQAWWRAQLGPLYIRQHECPAREPVSPD
jgi:hypothetical protein